MSTKTTTTKSTKTTRMTTPRITTSHSTTKSKSTTEQEAITDAIVLSVLYFESSASFLQLSKFLYICFSFLSITISYNFY